MTLPIRKATPAELKTSKQQQQEEQRTSRIDARNIQASIRQDQRQQQQQAMQAMRDMRKAQAARPRTGVPGPEMPMVKPGISPQTRMEPVEIEKAKAQADMMANMPKMPNPDAKLLGAIENAKAQGNSSFPMNPSPAVGNAVGNAVGSALGKSMGMKRGGAVRNKPQTKFASGGSVGSASKRGDGIAQRGKTKGRMC